MFGFHAPEGSAPGRETHHVVHVELERRVVRLLDALEVDEEEDVRPHVVVVLHVVLETLTSKNWIVSGFSSRNAALTLARRTETIFTLNLMLRCQFSNNSFVLSRVPWLDFRTRSFLCHRCNTLVSCQSQLDSARRNRASWFDFS